MPEFDPSKKIIPKNKIQPNRAFTPEEQAEWDSGPDGMLRVSEKRMSEADMNAGTELTEFSTRHGGENGKT